MERYPYTKRPLLSLTFQTAPEAGALTRPSAQKKTPRCQRQKGKSYNCQEPSAKRFNRSMQRYRSTKRSSLSLTFQAALKQELWWGQALETERPAASVKRESPTTARNLQRRGSREACKDTNLQRGPRCHYLSKLPSSRSSDEAKRCKQSASLRSSMDRALCIHIHSYMYRWGHLKLDNKIGGRGGVSLELTRTHLVPLGLTWVYLD